ncbi:hypothetical protein RJ55_06967 [Drechmeria coniospora]|nr:hypothetical protein RJ55_06967 [Drechmeria coniospora]
MKIFPESSFFRESRASALPTPAEVREANKQSGYPEATCFYRPPPVVMPLLGLLVKYGAKVTLSEIQSQIMVRSRLDGQVPVPEVFGWTEDEGQFFIYMALIDGETLQDRWGGMNEEERLAVCEELRSMAKAWRNMKQEGNERYVGSLGKQPLKDVFLRNHTKFQGPFQGEDAVRQLQSACYMDIDGEDAIVFTHGDLIAPNILLSAGRNPKVAAVIDWGQAGWYPAYWENCKAREVWIQYFDAALQTEWQTKYLPLILDTVEDTTYLPFRYFVLSYGI